MQLNWREGIIGKILLRIIYSIRDIPSARPKLDPRPAYYTSISPKILDKFQSLLLTHQSILFFLLCLNSGFHFPIFTTIIAPFAIIIFRWGYLSRFRSVSYHLFMISLMIAFSKFAFPSVSNLMWIIRSKLLSSSYHSHHENLKVEKLPPLFSLLLLAKNTLMYILYPLYICYQAVLLFLVRLHPPGSKARASLGRPKGMNPNIDQWMPLSFISHNIISLLTSPVSAYIGYRTLKQVIEESSENINLLASSPIVLLPIALLKTAKAFSVFHAFLDYRIGYFQFHHPKFSMFLNIMDCLEIFLLSSLASPSLPQPILIISPSILWPQLLLLASRSFLSIRQYHPHRYMVDAESFVFLKNVILTYFLFDDPLYLTFVAWLYFLVPSGMTTFREISLFSIVLISLPPYSVPLLPGIFPWSHPWRPFIWLVINCTFLYISTVPYVVRRILYEKFDCTKSHLALATLYGAFNYLNVFNDFATFGHVLYNISPTDESWVFRVCFGLVSLAHICNLLMYPRSLRQGFFARHKTSSSWTSKSSSSYAALTIDPFEDQSFVLDRFRTFIVNTEKIIFISFCLRLFLVATSVTDPLTNHILDISTLLAEWQETSSPLALARLTKLLPPSTLSQALFSTNEPGLCFSPWLASLSSSLLNCHIYSTFSYSLLGPIWETRLPIFILAIQFIYMFIAIPQWVTNKPYSHIRLPIFSCIISSPIIFGEDRYTWYVQAVFPPGQQGAPSPLSCSFRAEHLDGVPLYQ